MPDLDAIKQRADAATPGPWELTVDVHGPGNTEVGVWADASGYYVAERIGSTSHPSPPDGLFIAHARTDVPALLDLLAERDTTIARLTAAISGEGDCTCACSEGGPEEIDDLCPTDGIIADAKARAEQWGHQLDEIAQALGGEWLEPFPPSDVATEVTRRLATIARLEAELAEARAETERLRIGGHTNRDGNLISCGETQTELQVARAEADEWWRRSEKQVDVIASLRMAVPIFGEVGICAAHDCPRAFCECPPPAPVLGSQVDVTRADSTGNGE